MDRVKPDPELARHLGSRGRATVFCLFDFPHICRVHARIMTSYLPDDVIHLICVQLWHMREFNTLFSCALASKALFEGAIPNLYRYSVTPLTDRDQSTLTDDRLLRKWANLWRTLILSSLGKTKYPYCRYLRILDFGDLKDLLEDPGFHRKSLVKEFFAGDLEHLLEERERKTRSSVMIKRINTEAVIDKIGDVLTPHTPVVEELAGDLSNSSVLRWIPKLRNLAKLRFMNGGAIAGAGQILKKSCPNFKDLTFFNWRDPEADELFAQFLSDIKPNSFEALQVASSSTSGRKTLEALNRHGRSLKTLRFGFIEPEVIRNLSDLKDCTAIRELELSVGPVNISVDTNPSAEETTNWLATLTNLETLHMKGFPAAHDILTPFLHSNSINLVALEVTEYDADLGTDFHRALVSQAQSLKKLVLIAEADVLDQSTLVESICRLTKLTELRLASISNFFTSGSIISLAESLPNLEEFLTSGWNVTDIIWPSLAGLRSLKRLDIYAISDFSLVGILDFIELLGPGNRGLTLAIAMADPSSQLQQSEQDMVRDVLENKLEGRFEYNVARGNRGLLFLAENKRGKPVANRFVYHLDPYAESSSDYSD